MKEIIERLYLTNRGFVTDDYKECLDYINENEIGLQYHSYPSGTEIWDSWVIPKKWSVNEAYVEADGERLIDYDNHPLHLISYSDSIESHVSKDELSEHIHTHPEIPDAIPWHFRLNYRPWEREWGFCASQSLVESLDNDEYYVNIDTSFSDGEMQVAEHHIQGESDETIVLAAHLDHTGMANDDLAGVSVGIELMKQLQNRKQLRYSYKFLIVQEMTGSAAYLSSHKSESENFKYGIFLEMPGNDNRLLLQRSFTGNTRLDRIAAHRLHKNFDLGEVASFREVVGNDEIIFEGPGYEVPTVSISRAPYEEYHTHLDNPDIISENRLEQYCEYVESVIDVLETDFVPVRTFDGVPSLAHPKYDLYLDPEQPALQTDSHENIEGDIPEFRDRLLRYLDGNHTVFDIAVKFDLDFDWTRDYLLQFEQKGLIKAKHPSHT